MSFFSGSEPKGQGRIYRFMERRDGFKATLVFGAPRRSDLFGSLSEKREKYAPLMRSAPSKNFFVSVTSSLR